MCSPKFCEAIFRRLIWGVESCPRYCRKSLTDFGDDTDALMPEDAANRHLGNVAFGVMQIRTADRRCCHLDDHIRRVFDPRVRDVLPGFLTGAPSKQVLS